MLRIELTQHVRRACGQPSTAVEELAEIWNEVADRGEFLFRDSRSLSGERHPRPKILPPRPEKSSRARNVRARPVSSSGHRSERRSNLVIGLDDGFLLVKIGHRATGGVAPALAQGLCQGDKLIDVERLGAELAAESLRLEPGDRPRPCSTGRARCRPARGGCTCGGGRTPGARSRETRPRRRRRPVLTASGRMATTAESTWGRGQKTVGGSERTIDTSASAWITTETAP